MPDIKQVRLVKGDIFIKNVPIVDPVNEIVETGMDILIRSGKIYDIQPTGTIEFKNAAIVIPGEEFYAMPGFVNTHTHLWQHLSRSVSPSSQLQEWIPKVYRPSYHLTDEEFYKLNYAACNDALLHGITTVIDWTINADETKTRFPYRSPSDTTNQQVHQLNVELPPGGTLFLKKKLGGNPMTFIISTDTGFEKTMEITLPYDPVWDWALRANVYVETRFITNR